MSRVHEEMLLPVWKPGRGDELGSGSWPGPGPGSGTSRGHQQEPLARAPGDCSAAKAAFPVRYSREPFGAEKPPRADGGPRLPVADNRRANSATRGRRPAGGRPARPTNDEPAHSQSGSCGSCLGSSSSGNALAEAEAECGVHQMESGRAHREGEGEAQLPDILINHDIAMVGRSRPPQGKNHSCSGANQSGKYPSRYQQYYPGYLPGGASSRPGPPRPAGVARWAEGEGEVDIAPAAPSVSPAGSNGPAKARRSRQVPRKACSHTSPGGGPVAKALLHSGEGNSGISALHGRSGSSRNPQPQAARTPIHTLSEDLLVGIFQQLSTSEWRLVVPQVCKRWGGIIKNCSDMWTQVEVCPFENSEVSRRLIPNVEERYWPVDAKGGMRWLASSSLSRQRVLRSLIPQAGHIRALLLSCLTLTLAPEAVDNQDDDTRQTRWVRASDFETEDLILLVREARHSLRHFMLRVSGEIARPELLAEVCQAKNLELLHAELGNIELDCSMLAPLKRLTSLRLRRDELSLDMNEGGMKLINLDCLSECKELTRLSIGFDTHLVQLPQQICNLSKLTTLEVDRCSNMERLPACISKLTRLETLSLSGSSSLPALPSEMKSLAQLVSLNLDFCTQMSALPTEIGSLINLRRLSMEGGYAIFDDGVPFEIGLCGNLQSLVLADTHILSLAGLAEKLASCSSLQVLSLDHNDDLQVECYPHQIMALPKLMMLSMRKYERQSWSVTSTRNIARMQEEATQLRLQKGRLLQIIL